MESPQTNSVSSEFTDEDKKRLEEIQKKPVLFPPVSVFSTPGAMSAIKDGKDVYIAMHRHFRGDWGDTCPEDAEMNNQAVKTKDRIISSFTATNGTKFWIITDAGHINTTILLPDEY